MVVAAFTELWSVHPEIETVIDLGAGDGTFLEELLCVTAGKVRAAGVDAGHGNVNVATTLRRPVFLGNLWHWAHERTDDVAVLTEVLEHLVNPHKLVSELRTNWLIVTSPSGESDRWHYEHHAWAWDREGYERLVTDGGWKIKRTYECAGPRTLAFGPSGEARIPTYQCIVAKRIK